MSARHAVRAWQQRLTLTLAFGLIYAGCTPHPGPTRDIVITARGMSFMLEDGPVTANPVIRLRAGERVRLVLKNEAPGLLHDLVIPDLGVEMEQIRAGETAEATLAVPDITGRYSYHCRPHRRLMTGIVEVTR